MGNRISWTPDRIKLAVTRLREYDNYEGAAPILSRDLGCVVTPSAMRSALERHGVHVSAIIGVAKAREARDPSMLSDDQLTDHVAQLIQECADQTKLAPQDVTWVDFKNFTEYYWGKDQQKIIKPRHITRVGGFAAIRDAYYPPNSTKFSMERLELHEKARLHRSVSLIETVNAAFLRQLEEVAERAFGGKITPTRFALKKRDPSEIERTLNAVWSDLHFQALLDNREVPMAYGPHEEARRFAAVIIQAGDWKPQYRKNTSLRILALGDWIQNQLHDMRDGAPLAEQACAAIHYGMQGISYLSALYGDIWMYCVPGNHGRNTARHPNRATLQKWDAIETVIYYGIKAACRNLPNVHVVIPRTPYFTWDSFGLRGYGTHGDTTFNPGMPGTVIRTKDLADQSNRLNAALPDAHQYKVIVCGHVHTADVLHMSNGCKLVTNGALIPSDQYAISIGIPETQCGQMLFESTPKFIVGDNRLAEVGPETDKDAALETVVPPFTDF